LTSFRKVFGPRFALGGALLVSACQHDSDATFDDTKLTPPGPGASGSSNTGGSDAEAGTTSQGAVSAGGSQASAGSSAAGKASGGASGSASGAGNTASGSGGVASGGKAGMDAGGAAGQAGKAGQGGAGGSAGVGGTAGAAGGKNDPVTIEITDIADTDVSSCMTGANHGEEKTINVDGDEFCVVQSLINAPLSQIPDGALVSEATLTLTCINVGDPATVYFVNEQWGEDSVRWTNKPNVGAVLGSLSCPVLGKVTIDLKAAVKAWLGGDHAKYGIYIRMETTDGIDFSSSEADKVADRPKLTITYTLPAK
jgi:hypothetical protein